MYALFLSAKAGYYFSIRLPGDLYPENNPSPAVNIAVIYFIYLIINYLIINTLKIKALCH
jgi:hypothetical protein